MFTFDWLAQRADLAPPQMALVGAAMGCQQIQGTD